jgi:imidazole glycerol-phosphate synthase subunit HisH
MVVIVDYKAGNLTSVKRALDFLGIPCEISADPQRVRNAERVIFPGVGHAASAMATLRERRLDAALRDVYRKGTPLLGICLGAQIVLARSEEGNTECLGLLDGTCPRFQLTDPALKIPHMGWDRIALLRPHPVLSGLGESDEFYFVHSFYPRPRAAEHVLATCEYETTFAAAVGSANLIATQFHPEKSGESGLAILRNFSRWDGAAC